MRWLLVEDWASHIYAEPFFQRLGELGEEVHSFKECTFYQTDERPSVLAGLANKWIRGQHRLRLGPRIVRLNLALLKTVEDLRPQILFVFRGDQIFPSTLASIGQRGIHIIGWHNDNPFSPRYPWYVWRHFRRSVALFDRLYAYRAANLEDFRRAGCRQSDLLRSFFIRELNYPGPSSPDYACDVSFSGHWEPDGRDDYVAELLDADEIDFRLWGTLWERSPIFGRIQRRLGKIEAVYKERYNAALSSSRIALVFLSGLNQDTYTRRCFEIPATRTFMLAQYSPDLSSMFTEGREAEYFRNPDEMMDKIRFYLRNESARAQIAAAGHIRVHADGHEALDRARQVRNDVLRDLGQSKSACQGEQTC
jgi:spore maturation protein CgeB